MATAGAAAVAPEREKAAEEIFPGASPEQKRDFEEIFSAVSPEVIADYEAKCKAGKASDEAFLLLLRRSETVSAASASTPKSSCLWVPSPSSPTSLIPSLNLASSAISALFIVAIVPLC